MKCQNNKDHILSFRTKASCLLGAWEKSDWNQIAMNKTQWDRVDG